MTYIFDFIDLSGQIDHFDMVMCPDDFAARAAAKMALAGSSTAV